MNNNSDLNIFYNQQPIDSNNNSIQNINNQENFNEKNENVILNQNQQVNDVNNNLSQNEIGINNGVSKNTETSFNQGLQINDATDGNNNFLQNETEINNDFNQNIVTPLNQNSEIDNEELLKDFIGINYDKITNKNFNFAGFFFNIFYMFYRKMFLYALVVFLVSLFILNVIKNFYVTIIFNLIIGLIVNKIYVFYAKNKIAKIKIKNPQKSEGEIKSICSKIGGTSVGMIFLGFLVEFIIALIVIMTMTFFGISSIFGNIFNISAKNGTFDGVIFSNPSVNILNEFDIKIPSGFEEGLLNNTDAVDYKYKSGKGMFDECSFTLLSMDGFSSAENLINQMHEYYKDDNATNVINNDINDINWYSFSYTDSMGQKYYYATNKNKKVYLFEYNIQTDADITCPLYKDQVLNSIIKK